MWCEPPQVFSFDAPAWPAWRNRFLLFAKATKLAAEEQDVQMSALLYCMGEQADAICNTFTYTLGQEKTMEVLLEKFDEYFMPRISGVHTNVSRRTDGGRTARSDAPESRASDAGRAGRFEETAQLRGAPAASQELRAQRAAPAASQEMRAERATPASSQEVRAECVALHEMQVALAASTKAAGLAEVRVTQSALAEMTADYLERSVAVIAVASSETVLEHALAVPETADAMAVAEATQAAEKLGAAAVTATATDMAVTPTATAAATALAMAVCATELQWAATTTSATVMATTTAVNVAGPQWAAATASAVADMAAVKAPSQTRQENLWHRAGHIDIRLFFRLSVDEELAVPESAQSVIASGTQGTNGKLMSSSALRKQFIELSAQAKAQQLRATCTVTAQEMRVTLASSPDEQYAPLATAGPAEPTETPEKLRREMTRRRTRWRRWWRWPPVGCDFLVCRQRSSDRQLVLRRAMTAESSTQ